MTVPIFAVLGDLYVAQGLLRALAPSEAQVRVLCPDEAAAREVLAAGQAGATDVKAVQGSPDAPEVLDQLLAGARSVAFLSPVGLSGRSWRPQTHIADLKRVFECAAAHGVARFLYLSSPAASSKARAACLREAEQAEKLVSAAPLTDYCLRAAPVVGRGDPLLRSIARQAARPGPLAVVWGYADTTLQPIHVDDLGLCLARLVAGAGPLKPGTYCVAGPDTVTVMDLLDRAAALRGRHKVKIHIPLFILGLVALVRTLCGPKRAARFRERVLLLSAGFQADKNDWPALCGPAQKPRPLREAEQEAREAEG